MNVLTDRGRVSGARESARFAAPLVARLAALSIAACAVACDGPAGEADAGTSPLDASSLDAALGDGGALDDAGGLDAATRSDASLGDDAGGPSDGGPSDGGAPDAGHFAVLYDGNGATGGSLPVDATPYAPGERVMVAAPGTLVRAGFTFVAWNTRADGTGDEHLPGSTFVMGTADVTLFASWTPAPTFAVTYHADDRTAGTLPVDASAYLAGEVVTVAGAGDLARTGHTFATWSTAAVGGTARAPGSTFPMPAANVDLFAQWTAREYAVTYDANGASSGTPPSDPTVYHYGDTASVRGNTGGLARAGYTFGGWNTQADGLGTAYAPGATFVLGDADVTLYAVWAPMLQTIVFDAVGGSGTMAPITAPTGSTVTLPANAFTRSHWAFAGWGTTLSGWVVHANRASFTMPPSSLTLYAKWTIPMVSVPAGTFQRDDVSSNTSTVSAFQMARYEVTVDQILELGFTDTTGAGTNLQLPFDDASWYFALVLCNRLSIREGRTPVYSISGSTDPASWGSIPTTTRAAWDGVVADWSADGYRMPTEMEWVWAAMGARNGATGYTKPYPGSTGSGSIDAYAWLGTNSGGVRHTVGTRTANELGIYDLAGNAYEHVWDREDDYYYVSGAVTDYRGPGTTTVRTRVYRGGAYDSAASWARLDSIGRSWQPEYYAYSGIRLVRR